VKFPSTLLAQIKDKSDPKDVEREIQKADLDLLSKINEVASLGSSVLALNQKDYTERANDGYGMIDVTCGSSQRTILLAQSSTVMLRSRTYGKNDSGAGELKLQCQGADVIKYAGGSATSVYVGLQYQNTTLLAIPGGYVITGGVTQPVASEPSLGTLHLFPYNATTRIVVNGVAGSAAWSGAVDCSPYVPVGTKAVLAKCLGRTGSGAAGQVNLTYLFNNTNGPAGPVQAIFPEVSTDFIAAGASANYQDQSVDKTIPLSTALAFYYYRLNSINTATPILYVSLLGYYT
jgi:hypothetical protein